MREVMCCPTCYGEGFFSGSRFGDDDVWIQGEDIRCEHCKGTGRRTPDRVIDDKPYCWEGHYLVDEKRYCPHGVFVEYRCNDCDRDHGGPTPGER